MNSALSGQTDWIRRYNKNYLFLTFVIDDISSLIVADNLLFASV